MKIAITSTTSATSWPHCKINPLLICNSNVTSSIASNIPTTSWLVFMEKCASRTEPISCLEAEAIWWKRERWRGRKMLSRWKNQLPWQSWKALLSHLTLSAVSCSFSPDIEPLDCLLLQLLIQILTRWLEKCRNRHFCQENASRRNLTVPSDWLWPGKNPPSRSFYGHFLPKKSKISCNYWAFGNP